jgi:DNA-binding response OmpR family regulator
MAKDTKVLVIEDELETQELLATQLEAHGYATEVAGDAISGLAAARKHRPDAVLLDLGLPRGEAFRVLERLYDIPALASVPVVVMTGRRPSEPSVVELPKFSGQPEFVRALGEALRPAA